MKTASILAFASVAAVSLSMGSANAQSTPPQPAGSAPPMAAAPDPIRVPGDRGPMIPRAGGPSNGPPAGAPAGSRPPEQGTDAPGPSLALAVEAAQAAIDACLADGFKVGVAVVDSTGQPRVGMAADHALGGHVYTAVRKGLAALAFGTPTSAITPEQRASDTAKPNMTLMAGGVPLMAGGKVIGAIGASGASSGQDEKCALAGANKVKDRLK